MGFGLTLASASTLGVVYRGVKFVPVVDDHDKLRVSAVWSAKNDNAALKLLVDMIATGRSIILNRTPRSEEHTSKLQSLMRISSAVFCLNTKTTLQPPVT